MIHLVLAIVCSTSIAVIFKLARDRVDALALITVNYAAAVAAAGLLLQMEPPVRGLEAQPALLALGGGLGVLFVGGFLLLAHAVRAAGISLATATMRLSVAIPFLASWVIWAEVPTPAQGLGLVLALAALVLISKPEPPTQEPRPAPSGWISRRDASASISRPDAPAPKSSTGARTPSRPVAGKVAQGAVVASALLVLLFLTGGAVDTTLKWFEEAHAAEHSRALFLIVAFAAALLVGGSMLAVRRIRTGHTGLSRRVLGLGAVLGFVNYGSAEFMLRALREIPGTVAFPVNNVAVVALATLLGIGLWRESISRGRWLGLGLAASALVLFGF